MAESAISQLLAFNLNINDRIRTFFLMRYAVTLIAQAQNRTTKWAMIRGRKFCQKSSLGQTNLLPLPCGTMDQKKPFEIGSARLAYLLMPKDISYVISSMVPVILCTYKELNLAQSILFCCAYSGTLKSVASKNFLFYSNSIFRNSGMMHYFDFLLPFGF